MTPKDICITSQYCNPWDLVFQSICMMTLMTLMTLARGSVRTTFFSWTNLTNLYTFCDTVISPATFRSAEPALLVRSRFNLLNASKWQFWLCWDLSQHSRVLNLAK
jgi:hypothetical protein